MSACRIAFRNATSANSNITPRNILLFVTTLQADFGDAYMFTLKACHTGAIEMIQGQCSRSIYLNLKNYPHLTSFHNQTFSDNIDMNLELYSDCCCVLLEFAHTPDFEWLLDDLLKVARCYERSCGVVMEVLY